jgi:hypothetical protein
MIPARASIDAKRNFEHGDVFAEMDIICSSYQVNIPNDIECAVTSGTRDLLRSLQLGDTVSVTFDNCTRFLSGAPLTRCPSNYRRTECSAHPGQEHTWRVTGVDRLPNIPDYHQYFWGHNAVTLCGEGCINGDNHIATWVITGDGLVREVDSFGCTGICVQSIHIVSRARLLPQSQLQQLRHSQALELLRKEIRNFLASRPSPPGGPDVSDANFTDDLMKFASGLLEELSQQLSPAILHHMRRTTTLPTSINKLINRLRESQVSFDFGAEIKKAEDNFAALKAICATHIDTVIGARYKLRGGKLLLMRNNTYPIAAESDGGDDDDHKGYCIEPRPIQKTQLQILAIVDTATLDIAQGFPGQPRAFDSEMPVKPFPQFWEEQASADFAFAREQGNDIFYWLYDLVADANKDCNTRSNPSARYYPDFGGIGRKVDGEIIRSAGSVLRLQSRLLLRLLLLQEILKQRFHTSHITYHISHITYHISHHVIFK